MDTWDIQWKYCVFNNQGICVFPNKNLITNIGFGEDATHTIDTNSARSKRERFQLNAPIKSPVSISVDPEADRYMAEKVFLSQSRIKLPIRELVRQLLEWPIEKLHRLTGKG